MDVYQGTGPGGVNHCADIAAGLGRVEETLKLIEINGRGSDAEVKYTPREDAAKIYARVRCNIIQIGDIDTVKQEFLAEIFLGVTWKEPSVKGKKAEDVDWSEQWQPRVYFFNLVETSKMQIFHSIFESNDGGTNSVPDVQLGIRMKATFKCEMRLQNFPFDYQPLTIKLMSDWPLSEVEFVKDMNIKDAIRVDTFTGTQEWTLVKHVHAQQVKEDKAKTGSHREYPIYHITMHVQRKSAFYLWNVALIMFLIVLLSFTSFAVSSDEPADRLSVTLTLLLTAVAFKYVVSQSLPTISYLTLLDKYVLFGLVFQCLMVGQNAIASIFSGNLATLFDYICLASLAFIIIIAQVIFIISALVKRRAARRDLDSKTKQYEELCELINKNWKLRQESQKQAAEEIKEEKPLEEAKGGGEPEEAVAATQSSQNGNADTSAAIPIDLGIGAEPVNNTKGSRLSWRRSKHGSEKKKEEKNKVELLSIKPIGDIYPNDDLEAGSVDYDATL